jgi:ribosome-associated protein
LLIYEDSRQQVGKHKNISLYCQRHCIELVRKKLEVGDYAFPDGKISVDTKQDMLEICKDIMSSDHRRFRAECQRAKDMGIQLIILTEEVPPFGIVDLWEVPRWRSSGMYHRYGDPMTLVEPKALAKAMQTMTEKYGVKFRFCHRRETPRKLIKYLKGEYK